MRLVVAILKPAELEPVRHALAAVHVTRLTVCDAQDHVLPFPAVTGGAGTAAAAEAAGIARSAVMEIAVNDDFLARTVDTIAAAMRLADTGLAREAEPRIFVLPVDAAIQIYREVRGQEAI